MPYGLQHFIQEINHLPHSNISGSVSSVKGLLIECSGLQTLVGIGSRCAVTSRDGREIIAEVVGVKDNTILLMPFTETDGIGVGCRVRYLQQESSFYPDFTWQGRVLNALADPIDDNGPLLKGDIAYGLKNNPPTPHKRREVSGPIDLGVRAINTLTTCCQGQRMGIFAGSGVGKSMLVAMLTHFAKTDVKVIGLIGERGREVKEFIDHYLGPEGMKNTVVVVSTSNESALMRRQAAYLTMTIAEFFRDRGSNVLCMIDSVTRFAMAQREIGLSAGEPPTSKGYTPTVFSELPKLLERAGPGCGTQGDITGIFSVLVEGDDHNEPISDAARGILDGHIVLDRHIAERNRFPSINILRSISRMVPKCHTNEQTQLVNRARKLLSIYNDMEEMIRLGAYRKGTDPAIDEAIYYYEKIEAFLNQSSNENSTFEEGFVQLASILEMPYQTETSDTSPLEDEITDTAHENINQIT